MDSFCHESVNGPWLGKRLAGGSAGLFYEGKVSTWQGGYEVPAVARRPRKILAGVTSQSFATTMDLFVSFAKPAGAKMPTDRHIDGCDISSLLFENASSRKDEMFYYFGDELWAVRRGPWKIHAKTTSSASVSTWGDWPIEERDPPLLFNVEQDPSEKHNVAAQAPGSGCAAIEGHAAAPRERCARQTSAMNCHAAPSSLLPMFLHWPSHSMTLLVHCFIMG